MASEDDRVIVASFNVQPFGTLETKEVIEWDLFRGHGGEKATGGRSPQWQRIEPFVPPHCWGSLAVKRQAIHGNQSDVKIESSVSPQFQKSRSDDSRW